MTNPLGTGTANLSINVPTDERALWGRLGFEAVERGEARSAGDFQRRVLEAGLVQLNPEAARRLREIRVRYYASALAALLGLSSFLSSWFGGDDEQARRSSSVAGIRVRLHGRRQELEVMAA